MTERTYKKKEEKKKEKKKEKIKIDMLKSKKIYKLWKHTESEMMKSKACALSFKTAVVFKLK